MMRSSLRDNFRYLLVEYDGKTTDVRLAVTGEIERYLGVLGRYETGAKVVAVEEGKAVVRVLRGQEKRVCAGLALVNNEEGSGIRMRVLRISGTIAALCKKEGIKRSKKTGTDSTRVKRK